MLIKGIDNQIVELKISNYQFPYTLDRDYDGNWLNIYLNVDSKLGKWQTIDPSLLTWEVEEFIDWFLLLSMNNEPKYNDLEFIEPNLSFHILNSPSDEIKKIRIDFQLESRPKSAKEDDEYFVIFEANNKILKELATDLQKELNKYPIRK